MIHKRYFIFRACILNGGNEYCGQTSNWNPSFDTAKLWTEYGSAKKRALELKKKLPSGWGIYVGAALVGVPNTVAVML